VNSVHPISPFLGWSTHAWAPVCSDGDITDRTTVQLEYAAKCLPMPADSSDFCSSRPRRSGGLSPVNSVWLTVLAPSAVQLQRANRRGLLVTPAMNWWCCSRHAGLPASIDSALLDVLVPIMALCLPSLYHPLAHHLPRVCCELRAPGSSASASMMDQTVPNRSRALKHRCTGWMPCAHLHGFWVGPPMAALFTA